MSPGPAAIGWITGDKAGTSGIRINDPAIVGPLGRAPLVVVADHARKAALRQVGSFVARWAA